MHRFTDNFGLFLKSPDFWVWLQLTAILIGFTLVCLRWLRVQLKTGTPPGPGALFLLAIIFACMNFRAGPTGDEPHYLIMTQSFLRDGDFDLRNNYENKDYLEYYPEYIPDPHVTVVGNRWYPVHGIGLSILAAPFFLVGGRLGVIGLLTLITVAGMGILWSLVHRAGFVPWTASVVTLIAGFTLPLASLSGQIFPEVPAFLLVALAFRAVLAPTLHVDDRIGVLRLRPMADWELGGFVLSLVILPWLHPKYMAISAALLLSAATLWRQPGRIRALAVAVAGSVVSIIALVLLSNQWYGVPLPGAGIMMAHTPFSQNWFEPIAAHFLTKPWVGLAGALFDQHSGLFFASPVYVIAIPGVILLWRRERRWAIACGLIFASVYLPAGAFGVWYGGFSSPARLLTPILPILALGIATALEPGKDQRRRLFTTLAILSFLHAYLLTALPSFTRYGDPVNQHNFFISFVERIFRLDLTPLFPSLRSLEPTTWLTTAIYLLAVITTTVLFIRTSVPEQNSLAGLGADQ